MATRTHHEETSMVQNILTLSVIRPMSLEPINTMLYYKRHVPSGVEIRKLHLFAISLQLCAPGFNLSTGLGPRFFNPEQIECKTATLDYSDGIIACFGSFY